MVRSFIEVEPDSHFPIQNLPYGVFRPHKGGQPRIGVAIGNYVLDLAVLDTAGCFEKTAVSGRNIFSQPSLNALMSFSRPVWKELRSTIGRLLDVEEPALRDNEELRATAMYLQNDVELLLPVEIGDYTDFYASKDHATNVGSMFRGKENALMPNWLHLPVGYHGRASSVVISGSDIRRPQGQMKPPDSAAPIFGSSRQLDFELEVGCLIGTGNEQGLPVSIEKAEDYIFGLVLVNDWSARDIQSWEYQPLGPFLAKNFATSISPWVVPLEALEPFRVPAPKQDPEPLPYLRQSTPGSFNIQLEVYLQSESMKRPDRISASNFSYLYWTMAQQIAHHTIGGCNLRPGDLLASGTISGPEKESRGSMLELTWRGSEPLQLINGDERVWLEDGDCLTMTGWCQGDGYRVGFGEVIGRVLPAILS
ncbi:fumarylacetoacetate hydrolase [Paenibacillus sp. yr247]|uniref:fumarylacetoacetase n=1 Tax=Paenibacillus sp. yr247 TaxID=1761880 RepID=UPI0008851B1F|nr:fumarylacetoacetase [Paenibacillus sp. yr247]SDO74576.1 fumarylacetoacetate hydrolase [Paenibacillus sp. yr247]